MKEILFDSSMHILILLFSYCLSMYYHHFTRKHYIPAENSSDETSEYELITKAYRNECINEDTYKYLKDRIFRCCLQVKEDSHLNLYSFLIFVAIINIIGIYKKDGLKVAVMISILYFIGLFLANTFIKKNTQIPFIYSITQLKELYLESYEHNSEPRYVNALCEEYVNELEKYSIHLLTTSAMIKSYNDFFDIILTFLYLLSFALCF